MHHYFSLQGRTALVTGGTRGIGRMIAQGFLEAGARVFICARNAEACAETAAELSPTASASAWPPTSPARKAPRPWPASWPGASSTSTSWSTTPAPPGAPLESYPVKGWEKVMQLNVTSVFSCIQQLLPLLRKAGSAQSPARVINIGSVAGISSLGEQAYAYGPSKAALHQLSRMLAKELVADHINVNVIAPGRFPSKMTQFIANDSEALAADVAHIPMKRWGREEEMSALALSLASTAGAYMTGNIIPIDGGFHL